MVGSLNAGVLPVGAESYDLHHAYSDGGPLATIGGHPRSDDEAVLLGQLFLFVLSVFAHLNCVFRKTHGPLRPSTEQLRSVRGFGHVENFYHMPLSVAHCSGPSQCTRALSLGVFSIEPLS